MSEKRLKIVLVGDNDRHKGAFALVWYTGKSLERHAHIPTIFENFQSQVRVCDRDFLLNVWGTVAHEEGDRLKYLAYQNTDIFLLFFSYDSVESLNNIRSKWAPEINSHCPKQRLFILVGVRTTVIEDYQVHEAMGESPFVDAPVTDEMVREVMAAIGAAGFVECCPLTNYSIQIVVEKALEIFVEKKRKWWQRKWKGNKSGK